MSSEPRGKERALGLPPLGARWLVLSMVFSLVIPVAGSFALLRFAGETRWVHEPIHSSVETMGGVIALGMAGLLLLRRRYPGYAVHYEWVAGAMVCMGLLDLTHACLHTRSAFFWSRALPTVLGGLLFAMVWTPERWVRSRRFRWFVALVAALTLPICAALILVPDSWPLMFSSEDYSFTAKLINMAGGAGFLAAGLYFARRYRVGKANEDLIFANHCMLFAIASTLFAVARMWGAVWWLFHGLRLLAYMVLLRYVVELYGELQLAQMNALASEVREQSRQVAARLRELDEARERAERRVEELERQLGAR